MIYLFQILIISLTTIVGCKNDTDYVVEKCNSKIYSTFEKIESSYSNIDLFNKTTPNFDNKANVLDYNNFYNESGVDAGDLDNSGLKHIILSANQTKNKININKGRFNI